TRCTHFVSARPENVFLFGKLCPLKRWLHLELVRCRLNCLAQLRVLGKAALRKQFRAGGNAVDGSRDALPPLPQSRLNRVGVPLLSRALLRVQFAITLRLS